jgi:hypothetical protein
LSRIVAEAGFTQAFADLYEEFGPQKLLAGERKQTADFARLLHVRCLRDDALIQIKAWRSE